jgi:hypothetical protein
VKLKILSEGDIIGNDFFVEAIEFVCLEEEMLIMEDIVEEGLSKQTVVIVLRETVLIVLENVLLNVGLLLRLHHSA